MKVGEPEIARIDKGDSHECIFLEGRDCTIQSVKPIQCAGFPNTWNLPGWRESCEAVPPRWISGDLANARLD